MVPIDHDDVEDKLRAFDITPSMAGYKSMALLFCRDIIGSARKDRTRSVANLLAQVVRIAGYLGQQNPEMLLDLERQVEWNAEN